MATLRVAPTNHPFDAAMVPKPSSINAALGDHQLLDIKLGRHFRNQPLTAVVDPQRGVILTPSSEQNDFMAMSRQRSDADTNRRLWLPGGEGANTLIGTGLELSNVGISLAPTTVIDGQAYAVLARRRLANGGTRIMLVSGYVDAAKFSRPSEDSAPLGAAPSFIANTAAEAAEEINLLSLPGWFASTEVRGAMIRSVADELRVGLGGQVHSVTNSEESLLLTGGHDLLDYSSSMWWRLTTTALPSYIHNVFRPPSVTMEGTTFEGAGFQFHMHTNSGQIIVGMNLAFDLQNREYLSLIHAEDGPLSDPILAASLKSIKAPPDALATRVDKYGLLLCPLDNLGQLTPRFYNFIEGSLRPAQLPWDLEGVYLSDAFVFASPAGEQGYTPPPGMSGFVDRADIPARQFFRMPL